MAESTDYGEWKQLPLRWIQGAKAKAEHWHTMTKGKQLALRKG